jgi:hypothetical protein
MNDPKELAMLRSHLTRTRLGIALAVLAGVVLGAVFGQPGNGSAAVAAVPKNKTLPTISGVAEAGQTLTATRGTWSNSPTSFNFSWSRCDGSGNGCAAIAGATAKIYTPTATDVGHTLRVTVTAHNASGAGRATSAPTSIVSPSGCPPGTSTIQIAQLAAPARLSVTSAAVVRPVTRSARSVQFDIQITACGGRPVQGANVYATPIPYNQFAGTAAHTDANGKVTITEKRQKGFPAGRHQRLLAVFIRAWNTSEPITAGVSTSRVVAFHIAH